MQLRPLESRDDFALVATWLSQQDNYQWLDLAGGQQRVSPEWLKIAVQRGTYVIRLFAADAGDRPIGVVALSDINTHFKTANIWVVLGDKAYVKQGYSCRATSRMLTLAFTELGLRSIHTWIVDHNPSIHIIERVRFRPIGRQRQCHYIDGRAYDRLWFDLLASEHEEMGEVAVSGE